MYTVFMNMKRLKAYISVTNEIKTLEQTKDALKMDILLDFKKDGIEKIETDDGFITRVGTRRWKYSLKVIALEERVKIAKVREEEKGVATATVSESIRYTQVKD